MGAGVDFWRESFVFLLGVVTKMTAITAINVFAHELGQPMINHFFRLTRNAQLISSS